MAPESWSALPDTDPDAEYLSIEAETLTIGNEPGAQLPSSGGPGVIWMYLLGSLLFIGCGVRLIARRRITER